MSIQNLPRITIVTPSFNQGKFIERTIESVLGQNYPHLEYIVVDGGSTDNTLEILKRYDDRLQWISEKDSGQSEAINKGFCMAKGEIVAWLNSDDVYLPGALETAGKYFAANPDVMMIYGEGYMTDENDTTRKRFPFTEPKFDLWKLIYYGDYILQQSTFFRRSVFDTIEMLGESLHYTMDWDLFIRIGKRFQVDYVPDYLGCIREHGEAKTSIGGPRRFREIKQLIRTHGIIRYPMAYFNYVWDAYGKDWFEAGTNGSENGFKGKGLKIAKSFLQSLLFRYQRTLPQGPYADGWLRKKSLIVLPDYCPAVKKRKLILQGEAVGLNVPFRLRMSIDRAMSESFRVVSPGSFQLEMEIDSSAGGNGCFHVEIVGSRPFVPSKHRVNADSRELLFLLKAIRITE
jgi:glycosyltransferase involved in cell wall biosynthesis